MSNLANKNFQMSSPVAKSDIMETDITKTKALVRKAEDDQDVVPKKVQKLDEDNQKDLSEKEEDLSETEFQDNNQCKSLF